MNLHFLKIRVAADPWILVDRSGKAQPGEPGDSPDWSAAAILTCHPYRGAAARGMILVEGDADPYEVKIWDAAGRTRDLFPAAALCAARWLFDAGHAAGEAVAIKTGSGLVEIIVLDSRNFGMALGNPRVMATEPRFPDRFSVVLPGKTLQLRLHDGGIPRHSRLVADPGDMIQVGCVARHELRLRARGTDALEAAAASVAAASLASYSDRDCSVLLGDSRIMVQWPEAGPMFLAAAPLYCLTGDIWLDDA